MQYVGNLIVVAAPSGAGKTSLVAAVAEADPQVLISVSHTTREQRPGEIDGEHYHFLSDADFQTMIDDQAFLEHADVYGCRYGTSRAWVEEKLSAGQDVILEIDWQGAHQAKMHFHEAVMIYVVPPSLDALEARLQARQQDASDVIAYRLAEAQADMAHYHEFEYVVVNDAFDQAVTAMQTIITAQRLSLASQTLRQRELLDSLLEKR